MSETQRLFFPIFYRNILLIILDKFISKVKKTIEKYHMISPGETILVAVSGGPDSICLLDVLNCLRQELRISLIIVHMNHGIRKKEAEIEANFVREKAFCMNIPFEQLSVCVPSIAREKGLSVEQAGRKLRYQFFKNAANQHQAQKVALGHHADDQAETILMRIIRGSGLDGLKGIPPKRKTIIRPLIECNRGEIEAYCKRRKIAYCVDSSNRESIYFRNKIRHHLIPLLAKEYNPSIQKNLLQLQAIIWDETVFWETITESYYKRAIKKESRHEIVLNISQLKKWVVALQRRVIRKGLAHLRESLDDIQFNHIEHIRQLMINNQGEKYFDLPDGIQIRKNYQSLHIIDSKYAEKSLKNSKDNNQWEYDLPLYQAKQYPQLGVRIITEQFDKNNFPFIKNLDQLKKNEACVDYGQLVFPLKIRNRRPGDRFKPLNVSFFKKIKSFFIDQKIPFYKREQVVLVTDNLNRIVWIADFQIDDRFKITENTKKILYIEKKNM